MAEPGDRVLVTSFGSGAGSDGFVLTVQPQLAEFRQRAAELLELGIPAHPFVHLVLLVEGLGIAGL